MKGLFYKHSYQEAKREKAALLKNTKSLLEKYKGTTAINKQEWWGLIRGMDCYRYPAACQKVWSDYLCEHPDITCSLQAGKAEFAILKDPQALKEFQKCIQKYPIQIPKPTIPKYLKAKPTGKRIANCYYYNPYKCYKEKLQDFGTDRWYYTNGFLFNHWFALAFGTQPKTSWEVETENTPDVSSLLSGKMEEAEILAECCNNTDLVMAHVLGTSGKEYFFNAKYVDLAFTLFPKSETYLQYHQSKPTMLVLKQAKKTVAFVVQLELGDLFEFPKPIQRKYEERKRK